MPVLPLITETNNVGIMLAHYVILDLASEPEAKETIHIDTELVLLLLPPAFLSAFLSC